MRTSPGPATGVGRLTIGEHVRRRPVRSYQTAFIRPAFRSSYHACPGIGAAVEHDVSVPGRFEAATFAPAQEGAEQCQNSSGSRRRRAAARDVAGLAPHEAQACRTLGGRNAGGLTLARSAMSARPRCRPARRRRSVSNGPGNRPLMVTLLITVLRDRPAMKPVRPARAPLERPSISIGAFTAAEVMLTMRPNLRAIMPSTVALISSIGVSMLASIALIQSSRVQLRKSPGGGPPALLIRISGSGQAFSTASRPAGVVMSPTISVTVTPGLALRISSAVFFSASAPRAVSVTCTPSFGQRDRAGASQTLARCADDGAAALDAKIHCFTPVCAGWF